METREHIEGHRVHIALTWDEVRLLRSILQVRHDDTPSPEEKALRDELYAHLDSFFTTKG